MNETTFHCQQLKAKVLENVTTFSQKGYFTCFLSIYSIRYRSLVFGCREMTAMQWSYLSDCLYQSEVSMDNRETSVQSK